jgi:hypothetical protein
MTNLMHRLLIYLFTSALHVSGFLLTHLQRQVYNFSNGSIARALTPYPGDLNHCRSCTPASEGRLKKPETYKAEVNR